MKNACNYAHLFLHLNVRVQNRKKGINNEDNRGSEGGSNDDDDDGDECGDDGFLGVNFWICDGDGDDDDAAAADDDDGKGDYTYAYDKVVIVRMMIIAVEVNRHVDDSDIYDDGRWVRSVYWW